MPAHRTHSLRRQTTDAQHSDTALRDGRLREGERDETRDYRSQDTRRTRARATPEPTADRRCAVRATDGRWQTRDGRLGLSALGVL